MRTFDDEAGAAVLAEGWRVHYNMVRDHPALGQTPAEAAGFLPMHSLRWLEILDGASRNRRPPKGVEKVKP
jgi:hypothetical protein